MQKKPRPKLPEKELVVCLLTASTASLAAVAAVVAAAAPVSATLKSAVVAAVVAAVAAVAAAGLEKIAVASFVASASAFASASHAFDGPCVQRWRHSLMHPIAAAAAAVVVAESLSPALGKGDKVSVTTSQLKCYRLNQKHI